MEEEDKENAEVILRDFLETGLGYKDANSVEIQRVHRMGKEGKPKPIIARFLTYRLRENECTGFSSAWQQLQNVSRSTLRNSHKKEKANGHL